MALPKPQGPYSVSAECCGAVFISGQLPIDPVSGLMPEDTGAQARVCLSNLLAAADAAGVRRLVSVTLYLTDMDDFGQVNAVYAEMIPGPYPARVCVGVSSLPRGASIEVSAVGSLS